MSVRETVKRHHKIISCLKRRSMSFVELQDEMKYEEELTSENLCTSIRTFQRDIKDIASIYGIEISHDKSRNLYFITNNTESLHSQRMRENFDLLNAMKVTKSFENMLIFEQRKPLGTEHMSGLLHAIKSNLKVDFSYTKFSNSSKSQRLVQPIAIKESRNRWYLIGVDTKDEKLKNFALDRILNLRISKIKFKKNLAINVEETYKHCFGIINGTLEKPEKIILQFTRVEGKYVQSLPLHHSQQLIYEDKQEMRFSYYLKPTHDFKMEILSYGSQVMVLEPKSLRNNILQIIEKALENYEA